MKNSDTVEYEVVGDPITLEDTPELTEAEKYERERRRLVNNLAVLKMMVEAKKQERLNAPRLAKKKAKNRVKNRMAKASRKRNR